LGKFGRFSCTPTLYRRHCRTASGIRTFRMGQVPAHEPEMSFVRSKAHGDAKLGYLGTNRTVMRQSDKFKYRPACLGQLLCDFAHR
jgi:hypothetical protein